MREDRMKEKLLLLVILLVGKAAIAQIPASVSIFEACGENGITRVVEPIEMVDLGLSVKWANMNVGAVNSEDYGDYYAWGEVTTKEDYSWSTYLWCDGTEMGMTKYCSDSTYGIVDNITTIEPSDDVVHMLWGGNWRLPTRVEWAELQQQCTWTWVKQNNVRGYLVTAPNGNHIFLPAAGYRGDTILYSPGSTAFYWSSSLRTNQSNYAYNMHFNSNSINAGNSSRHFWGLSVRPVCP